MEIISGVRICEPGPNRKVVGYFRSMAHASDTLDRINSYYSDNVRLLCHEGNFFVLHQSEPVLLGVDLIEREAELRETALAKLTPEEKVLLGLSNG